MYIQTVIKTLKETTLSTSSLQQQNSQFGKKKAESFYDKTNITSIKGQGA